MHSRLAILSRIFLPTSAAALMFASLAGCAGVIREIESRPVMEEHLEEQTKENQFGTAVVTASSRRLVMVNLRSVYAAKTAPPKARGPTSSTHTVAFVCAEPPPDTATNVATETRAALETAPLRNIPKIAGSLEEQLRQIEVMLATRTELVEIYRTATYSLCQLHMNGAMTDKQAAAAFLEMTKMTVEGATNVIAQQAGKASDALKQTTETMQPPASSKSPQTPTDATEPSSPTDDSDTPYEGSNP